MNIEEEVLVKDFIGKWISLLSTNSDIRVILNCVYICGNLHECMVKMIYKS
jgi:hypothetical protein